MNPRREFKVGLVGHVQCVVMVKDNVIVLPIESKGVVCAGTDFNNPVNWKILRVIFEVVPGSGLDVPHVGAGDVHVVFITAFRRLIFAPFTVHERRAIVPPVVALVGMVGQPRPQVSRLIVPPSKGVEEPGVLVLIVNRHKKSVERASIGGSVLPRRGREKMVRVVVGGVHRCVQNSHALALVIVSGCRQNQR